MNIGMIISTPFPPEEGIGFYAYNLSKKLIESGHEATVITRGHLKKEQFSFEGINVVKLPFLPIYPFHILFHGIFLNRFLKQHKDEFDVLNVHVPLTPIPNVDLPIVSILHGSLIGNATGIQVVDPRSLVNKILTRLVSTHILKKLLKKSDRVVTVSEPVCHEIQEFYGYKDVNVLYNGVDQKKFHPDKLKENYILYVGRLSYGKGIFDLLKAAAKMKDKNLSFFIVGEGELTENIKEFIKKKGLEEKVILMGHVHSKELVKIYQRAVIFVFPSHYEGFPTVVLEAMSSALPILLSDITAHKSIIKDGTDGLFFKKGDYLDMAEKFKILLDNDCFRDKLGENARKTVIKRYTWDKISKDYISLFNSVMENEL
ncbi:MAG: glycosyltransferase family 4 protein [Methanobacterium sp.]